MRKLLKIVVILLVLSWGAAGLRYAQVRLNAQSVAEASALTTDGRALAEIRVETTAGLFVLKNPKLLKRGDSTILKGDFLNETSREQERKKFEVRAYDRAGQLLRGFEERTIFATGELGINGSAPLNHNHGGWLEGVDRDQIARIEISESETARQDLNLAAMVPFAAHFFDWEKYSDLEE